MSVSDQDYSLSGAVKDLPEAAYLYKQIMESEDLYREDEELVSQAHNNEAFQLFGEFLGKSGL